ncbi:MAG: hypothetical protein B7Z54_07240, partial [Sphingobacteriales bacterium 12-47-4]
MQFKIIIQGYIRFGQIQIIRFGRCGLWFVGDGPHIRIPGLGLISGFIGSFFRSLSFGFPNRLILGSSYDRVDLVLQITEPFAFGREFLFDILLFGFQLVHHHAELFIPATEAVIKLQRDYGDRTDRQHARLKYVVAEKGE